MTTHRLTASQTIDRPIDEVFAFFARPENLGRITPPAMGFEQVSTDLEMRAGLEIDHRIRPLLGIPMLWRSRIEAYDPPHSFVDRQVKGPYRRWEHRHTFTPTSEGGTRIDDEVTYELPLGPLGNLAHVAVVRDQLLEIFRHRARTIESIFTTPAAAPKPMSVAVAGGTGFVGGAIAMELHRRGHRVVVLSHRGEAGRGPLPDAIEIRDVDVTTGEGVPEALKGLDALAIALAFRNSPIEAPRRGQTFMHVDANGTEHLVAGAAFAGLKRLLYVSGAGAAPDAKRHWFRAKWRAEVAVWASGIPFTIIRPTWIYGPRDVSLNRFIDFARRLRMVPMTNGGSQLLAPVFIDDAARLAADSLEGDAAAFQVFELGGPETLSMREVIARALRAAGLRRPILPGPTLLIKAAVAPLQLLPEPPLTPAAVDFINQPATVDIEPLLERMPRRLTPLDEGLASYLAPEAGPGNVAIDASPARSSVRTERRPV
ncbi:MAG TPA: NAD-dependent epimerase/dehydratase family protein [Candidatus Limnocylindrales bacterium]|nr:NAD-dependent epimerase/dehydratase family protein [Candidatus Limnocylindrales bacterium]